MPDTPTPADAAPVVEPGQVYRNTKRNTLYRVVLLATHSDTDEDYVVYQDIGSGRHFVRSCTGFTGARTERGEQVQRFVLEVVDGR